MHKYAYPYAGPEACYPDNDTNADAENRNSILAIWNVINRLVGIVSMVFFHEGYLSDNPVTISHDKQFAITLVIFSNSFHDG